MGADVVSGVSVRPLRVLAVIASADVSRGGPSCVAVNLCEALARAGRVVTLLTTRPFRGFDGSAQSYEIGLFDPTVAARGGYSRGLVAEVRRTIEQFDVLHLHGLWSATLSHCAAIARQRGVPYVLSCHGMLSAWRRGWRYLHKEVYYHLVERRSLAGAACVHYLTAEEASLSAQLCPNRATAVVPNGIWPEEFSALRVGVFRKRFGLGDKPLVVFLGRLHPIKRLDLQCAAFALLADRHPRLRWVFAGPDAGYEAVLRRDLARRGLQDRVLFTGLLRGRERFDALADATVYCQSSEHEGHSMAITEALAAGCPCVITRGCHFEDVERVGAGRCVDATPEALAEAIDTILCDPQRGGRMGRRGRRLALNDYAWPHIAERMLNVYGNHVPREESGLS